MSGHPLAGISVRFRGYKSFKGDYCELGVLSPINVIIGRNNAGKSAVLSGLGAIFFSDKIRVPAQHQNSQQFEGTVGVKITADHVSAARFAKDTSGGDLYGNHYEVGMAHVGQWFVRDVNQTGDFSQNPDTNYPENRKQLREAVFNRFNVLRVPKTKFLVLPPERAVRPEKKSDQVTISENGFGITNIVRAFQNLDSLPRKAIHEELLPDLNQIYQGDAEFEEIYTQENDGGQWEIYLRDKNGSEVRLSDSGSSLQSVFIIISYLRLLVRIDQHADWTKTAFCVEEPEYNMHPALLRRLLEYLSQRRNQLGFSLFISTHSPVCIDWATKRDDTKIIHVRSNPKSGTGANAASSSLQNRQILDDLDIRASDILQANGIIWVEGPSDRVYLRKWIDLASGGRLKEGVHYAIMFYGGRLLNHLEAVDEEQRNAELISLLYMNRNFAVLIDSDRKPTNSGRMPPRRLGQTKQRIITECEKLNAMAWVTEGKEIENYLSDALLSNLTEKVVKTDSIYVQVPQEPAVKAKFKGDKIALAHAAAAAMGDSDLGYMDLKNRLDEMCAQIRKWNGI